MNLPSQSDVQLARPTLRGTTAQRLWKLVGWVALAHVILILILSPGLYCSPSNSPEALVSRGEQAMKEGKYAEAMELFRKAMDQQPKPPPIYAQAAENHRLADRLSRENAAKAPDSTQPARNSTVAKRPATMPVPTATSMPAAVTAPERPPVKPFIPPELQPAGTK